MQNQHNEKSKESGGGQAALALIIGKVKQE